MTTSSFQLFIISPNTVFPPSPRALLQPSTIAPLPSYFSLIKTHSWGRICYQSLTPFCEVLTVARKAGLTWESSEPLAAIGRSRQGALWVSLKYQQVDRTFWGPAPEGDASWRRPGLGSLLHRGRFGRETWCPSQTRAFEQLGKAPSFRRKGSLWNS